MVNNKSIFSANRTRIFIHIFVWICIFSFPFIFSENNEWSPERLIMVFSFPIGFCCLFYFNSIVLVPKLIYKNKNLLYLLIIVVLCLIFVFLHGTLHSILFTDEASIGRRHHHGSFKFWIVLPYAFVFALSTSIRVLRDRAAQEKIKNETINENLKTELSFLRSQISPHFMFNVMNSIVALSRKKSDMLEPVVIKLSGLLRYMLYESDEQKVNIEKELEYLNSYIDLQKIRFGDEVTVVFVQHLDRTDFDIEPMLLIPFVENAFKHGVSMIEHPKIKIKLSLKNNSLEFIVFNNYKNQSAETKDKDSGIGLINVKRRLNLLYPDKHEFNIIDNGSSFEITITIKLND